MSKKELRMNMKPGAVSHRRRVIVATALVIAIVAGSGATAYLRSPAKLSVEKNLSQEAPITPSSLAPSSPSKEYIYAGGRLVATEEPAAGCSLSISSTSQNFPAVGGTGTVSVSAGAGCGWTASSGFSWITITSGATGTGNGTVNYSVQANSLTSLRTGTMTIAGQTFTVTQAGTSCNASVAPTSKSFGPNGGSASVSVTIQSGCGWTALSNAPWITITSGGSGTGNGTVSYSVLSNSQPNSRTGTMTIAGQTFTVTQTGIGGGCAGAGTGTGLKADYFNNMTLTGAPVLTRTDPIVDFNWVSSSPGGSIPIDQFSVRWTGQVQPQCTEAYTFYVLSDDGVRLWVNNQLIIDKWFDQAGPEWPSPPINLVSGQKYDIKVEYYENWAGAEIHLKWSSATIAKQTIPQTQLYLPTGCIYSISSSGQSFAASGGTGSVGVTAGTGCAWTAVSNAAFITITSGASGSGNGTVNYSVASNPNTTQRTGTMTIAGQTFTVTQAGTSCGFSLNPTNMAFSSNGGTSSITVTTQGGCAWTATSNAAWITITSGSSGTGSGTVNYSVATNTGAPRTGTMTIAGLTFTVTEAAASCTSLVGPPSQNFSAAGGTGTITVAWGSGTGCAWTAVSNNSWITITSGGSGIDNGTVTYSVAANTGAARVGSITVAGQTVTINQAAGGASNTSLSLTGSAFVNVPAATGSSLDVTGSLTVEAWVKTSNTSSQGIVERWNPSDGGIGFNGGYSLRIIKPTNQLRFTVFRNTADAREVLSDGTGPLPNDGQWHHFAGVYDATASPFKLRVYIDGHLRGTNNLPTFTVPSGNGNLTIGAAVGGNQKLTGLIEDVRVTGAALYNADFVRPYPLSPVTGTRALWHFNNDYADSAGTNTGTITGSGATFSTNVPAGGMAVGTPRHLALEWFLAPGDLAWRRRWPVLASAIGFSEL